MKKYADYIKEFIYQDYAVMNMLDSLAEHIEGQKEVIKFNNNMVLKQEEVIKELHKSLKLTDLIVKGQGLQIKKLEEAVERLEKRITDLEKDRADDNKEKLNLK